MEIAIEPVVAQDADEIFELIRKAHSVAAAPIGPHWSKAQVVDECRGRGWVARGSAFQILAFVLYRDLGEAWEISFLATCVSARGQGLMTQLLAKMQDDRPREKAIWLEVHESNLPARQLYERLGFQQTGRRPNYYADGGTAMLYNYG